MKIKFTLIVIAAAFLSIVMCSYRIGPDRELNGYDGTGATTNTAMGCNNGNGCHNVTTSNNPIVELDSAGISVSTYRPGGSYTVKISATNGTTHTLPKFGFQLATVSATGAGTTLAVQAGTWVTNSFPVHVQLTSATGNVEIPIVEQNDTISAATGTGGTGTTYVESVPWTAPVSGTGSIKIFGVLNAVTGSDNQSLAYYQVATPVTIAEAAHANGINDISGKLSNLSVYPTLMNDNITLSFDMKETAPITATMISINGQEVRTLLSGETLGEGSFKRSFDVNGLAPGIYLIRLETAGVSVVSKVVKQ